MNKIRNITTLLFLILSCLPLTTCEKPSEKYLIKAWENLQKNDPKTIVFEKIKEGSYRFKTARFPFDGELKVTKVYIYDDYSDISGMIEGYVSVKLVGFNRDNIVKESYGYHKWKQNNFLVYVTKTGKWMSSTEYLKRKHIEDKRASMVSIDVGKFPNETVLKFDKPLVFFNELQDIQMCYPLMAQNKEIGLIWMLERVDDKHYFYLCEKYKTDTADFSERPRGSIYGYTNPIAHVLSNIDNQWLLKEIDMPNYGWLSCASFCDNLVAYWAFEDAIFAYVYNIEVKSLEFNKEISKEEIATDYNYTLGFPVWNSDCTVVKFPTSYYLKTPLEINLVK